MADQAGGPPEEGTADELPAGEIRGVDTEVAQQLERMVGDLRALGESVGAVSATDGSPGAASPRTMLTATLVVAVVSAGAAWLLWTHGHEVLALFAPLLWIAHASRRQRRRRR